MPNVRREATGTDLVTAMIGLMMRSRQRYGGYIVHIGIVLMFLGFAGAGYKQSAQVLLEPGEQVEVGRFAVRHDRVSESDDGRKQMVTAHMTVFRDGEEVGELYPARWFFRKHETEPTTEVAIRRSISEDLYVTLAAYDIADQSASFQVTVNPLVNWVWFGFAILALGTGVALLPESAFAFVSAKVPAGASTATTSMLVLALVLGGLTTTAGAQVIGPSPESFVTDSELEAELQQELVCVCGDCPHYTLATCQCSVAERMRGELKTQLSQGQTKDQVRQYFIQTYGSQEPLGAPLDEGFNRLAWLFPYVVGTSFLVGLGVVVIRRSRHNEESRTPLPESETMDAKLEARLDDELRNLD